MTLRVATVLSVREWEPALVAAAHASATVRIIVRAFQPHDIDRHVHDLDVIVVGADTSWLTAAHVRSWRRHGPSVLGVAPVGDSPAETLLRTAGADEVVPDSIAVEAMIQAIRYIAPERTTESPRSGGRRIAVVGSRGAPGCTEVAVAYALSVAADGSCVLIDLDLEAPSLAVRLGIDPAPDLADAVDLVRADGSLDGRVVQTVGSLGVIVGPRHAPDAPFRETQLDAVIRAATNRWSTVVLDLGATRVVRSVLEHVDDTILVVEGSALGIVRAARLIEEWIGPAPALVVNRVDPSQEERVLEAARRWTGLEPAIVLPDRRAVRRAACSARAPERRFARSIGRLGRAS